MKRFCFAAVAVIALLTLAKTSFALEDDPSDPLPGRTLFTYAVFSGDEIVPPAAPMKATPISYTALSSKQKCSDDCTCENCACQFPGQCLLQWAQQNGDSGGHVMPNHRVIVRHCHADGTCEERTYAPHKVDASTGEVTETDEYITGTWILKREDGRKGWVSSVFKRAGEVAAELRPKNIVQHAREQAAARSMIESPMCVGGNCSSGGCSGGSCRSSGRWR